MTFSLTVFRPCWLELSCINPKLLQIRQALISPKVQKWMSACNVMFFLLLLSPEHNNIL